MENNFNLGNGLLGMFLSALTGGWGTTPSIFPSITLPSQEEFEAYKKECENATEEEKSKIYNKYFDKDGRVDKYFKKMNNKEAYIELQKNLIKYDKKIAEWTTKRQKVIDEWIDK